MQTTMGARTSIAAAFRHADQAPNCKLAAAGGQRAPWQQCTAAAARCSGGATGRVTPQQQQQQQHAARAQPQLNRPCQGLTHLRHQCSSSSRSTSSRAARRGGQLTTAAAAASAVPVVAAAAASGAPHPAVAALAVVVGWLVIAGSCFRSLPQIVRILRNQSVAGLSITSFVSELAAYSITVAYNLQFGYPFSTFGDTAICWVQNVAIVGLIFRYNPSVGRPLKLGITLGLAAFCAWLFSGACGVQLLTGLQAASVALLGLGGRLPQIVMNVRRGGSGELSMTTCALSVAGNLARIFTTLTLVRDPIILAAASSQLLLNGILTWQTLDTARRLHAAGGPSDSSDVVAAPA